MKSGNAKCREMGSRGMGVIEMYNLNGTNPLITSTSKPNALVYAPMSHRKSTTPYRMATFPNA